MNYTLKEEKSQVKLLVNTWIYISFNEDITEHLGDTIPYPHKHFVNQNTWVYCWLIKGFFGTQESVSFLNDVVARFKLTFASSTLIKTFRTETKSVTPLELKSFRNLKSIVNKQKEYSRADVQFDSTFWVLKYFAEDLIREDGMIIHQKLEDYAITNFIEDVKDSSTLRAKCRSIWNWYLERDWQIGRANKKFETKEELMASRKEHMVKINKNKKELSRKKILNCIEGMFKDDFKKPNGKWAISKIVEFSGVSRNIVAKHLKEIEKNKI